MRAESSFDTATRRKFLREVADMALPTAPQAPEMVSEQRIAALPGSVQRYLRFMEVVNRPRDWSFRAALVGRFRLKPDGPWRPMQAWQYNTRLEVARIFHMRLRVFGLVPVFGRDTYRAGTGEMQIRPFDVFTVQEARGAELDVGELVTYLNDAILLAPSMLLGPETTWSAVSDDAFDVSLTDRGCHVSARVYLDDRGAPRDFSTTDRFVQDPYDPRHRFIRARWSTPVKGWQRVEGRSLPRAGRAIWHLAQGEFPYVELEFSGGSIRFNVPPGE